MTTRTVTAAYVGADGQPLAGHLYFRPVTRLVDTIEETIVLPSPCVVELDTNGRIDVDLLTTDTATPQGWVWEVTERVDGHHYVWRFALPSGAAPFDLAGAAPIDLPDGTMQNMGPQGPAGAGVPDTTGADEGDVLQLFGPTLTPRWSDNLTSYGNRIDGNDVRLNNLDQQVLTLEQNIQSTIDALTARVAALEAKP